MLKSVLIELCRGDISFFEGRYKGLGELFVLEFAPAGERPRASCYLQYSKKLNVLSVFGKALFVERGEIGVLWVCEVDLPNDGFRIHDFVLNIPYNYKQSAIAGQIPPVVDL